MRFIFLPLLIQFFALVSCGQDDKFDLKNYVEDKRGTIIIDNVPWDHTILLKNKFDSNYTASVTHWDSTYANPMSIFFYYRGIANGPFKTYIDGKLLRTGSYRDGKRDGEYIDYENGYITHKKYFKNGLKVGVWEEYNKDGTIKRRTSFRNNEMVEEIKY